MMFNKNKNDAKEELKKKHAINGFKLGMMSSILSKNKANDPPNSEFQNALKDKIEVVDKPTNFDENDGVIDLLKIIQKSPEKMIAPKIDLSTGQVTYPLLEEIGRSPDDVDYLENLTSESSGVLEKTVYEKIVVCPKHPDSLSVNVRFYCPKCHSMNIEKLHLLEHIKCGYISEKNNFEVSKTNVVEKCPSCKKPIDDIKKELRVPAMWYSCLECEEKFDDVQVKLHCRSFNHDFDTNYAQSIEIPGFKIQDSTNDSKMDISSLIEKLKNLLHDNGFESEENHSAKGHSNHYHHIDLYGHNQNNKKIFIFIKKSDSEIDNSEINSKIIQVLDTTPDVAILIGFASISDKAKSIASSYNISIVSSQDPNEIVPSVEEVLKNQIAKIS